MGKIKTSSAIAADGTLYVGLGWYMAAINTSDGSLKWRTNRLRADVSEATPAIGADGTIYLGDRDNTLTAFNPIDGSVKWKYNINREGGIHTSPAIAPNGLIYFAMSQAGKTAGQGVVTALDPNGSRR